jgi:hypothetical protein
MDQKERAGFMPIRQEGYREVRFNINKADKIFDLLLQEGQIKLSPNNTIPTAEELRTRKYCKWHNAVSHNTNECKAFRQQIQSAIEQGRTKFDNLAKLMKIDGRPFPTNVVEVREGKAKVLTSKQARQVGVVDSRVQVSAEGLENQSRHEQG